MGHREETERVEREERLMREKRESSASWFESGCVVVRNKAV